MFENGIIISGFAGIGKTTIVEKYSDAIIDLESSDYKWIYETDEIKNMDKEARKGISSRSLNPEWPLNYVKEILEKTSEYEIVLISQDLDVRECLRENNTSYFVCFPSKECKEEYVARYKARNNPKTFIAKVEECFEEWIDALMNEDLKIIMQPGEYLETVLTRYNMLPECKKNNKY